MQDRTSTTQKGLHRTVHMHPAHVAAGRPARMESRATWRTCSIMAAVAAALLILSLLGREFDAESSQQAWEAPQEPPKYGSAPVVVSSCTCTLIHCPGHVSMICGLQVAQLAWHALKLAMGDTELFAVGGCGCMSASGQLQISKACSVSSAEHQPACTCRPNQHTLLKSPRRYYAKLQIGTLP